MRTGILLATALLLLTFVMKADAKEPAWQDGQPLTQKSTLAALKKAKKMTRSVKLDKPSELSAAPRDSLGPGLVTVSYDVKSLSETDLLTVAGQTTFSVIRKLFENPEVDEVRVLTWGKWTDPKGHSERERNTLAIFKRANVETFDFRGLEDRVILDNKHIFCLADSWAVHLGIYSRLKDVGCLLTPKGPKSE